MLARFLKECLDHLLVLDEKQLQRPFCPGVSNAILSTMLLHCSSFLILIWLESDRQRSDHKDDSSMDHNRDTFHTSDVFKLLQYYWQGNPGF
jgi:hypothetical protein